MFSSEPSAQSFSPLQKRPLSMHVWSPQASCPSYREAKNVINENVSHRRTHFSPQNTYRTYWLISEQKWFDFAFLVLEFAIFHSIFPVASLFFNVKIQTCWTTNGLQTLQQKKKRSASRYFKDFWLFCWLITSARNNVNNRCILVWLCKTEFLIIQPLFKNVRKNCCLISRSLNCTIF